MKHKLNLDLLDFHVREAAEELELLHDSIVHARRNTQRESKVGRKRFLYHPMSEAALATSLEHAYHHLNFAWRGRFKTFEVADAQFVRNEKFPSPRDWAGHFARFWPKSCLQKNRPKVKGSKGG